jgi:hypothetical protein
MLESAMWSSVQIRKNNVLQVAALVSAYCYFIYFLIFSERHVAAQLVEALHYKLEGCGFDS